MTPLTQEWNKITLGELVREESPICYGVLKPGEFTPDGVPLVRIVDLEGDKVRTDGLFKISSALDREFSRSRLRGGELLLSIQGTIGRVALAEDYLSGANISRTIARIDMRQDANPRFYRHWFLSDEGQKKLFDTVVGTTRASLNLGDVRMIQLPHPQESEQARIAEVLDALDNAIQSAEEIRRKRTKILQGLTHRLMTGGVDGNGNARDERGFPDLFEEKGLGRFPKTWVMKALGDLGETITGSTPPSSVPDVWGGEGLPFITPSEVTELGETLPAQRFVSAKGLTFVSRIPPGSLLTICIGSTLGKMALVQHECVTNQQINATIPGPGIDGTFLEHAIRLQMNRLLALAGLQAVPIVNRTQFESLTVIVAPPEEQRQIGDLIRAGQSFIQEESATIEKLRVVKSALSSDLLTGHIRTRPQ